MQPTLFIQQSAAPSDPGFSLCLIRGRGLSVVRLTGRIGLEYGEALEAALLGLLDRVEDRVVIDLSGLSFINVIGLGVIVRFGNAVRHRGGRMMLHGGDAQVGRLIRTVHLHELFPPFDPAEAADAREWSGRLATCA